MKKRGFVFAETLIVVSVLAISLIVIYRSFSGSIIREKRRINQDSPVYLYRTYNVKKFLESSELLDIYKDFIKDNNRIYQKVICLTDLTNDKRTFCEKLLNKSNFGIQEVYLFQGNFDDLFNDRINQNDLNQLSRDLIAYLKTLKYNNNGYILVVEYKDKCKLVEGSDVETCEYFYTSLHVGGKV